MNLSTPHDEVQRLAALARYGMLDTPRDAAFDFLAEMASSLCKAPYAFISLVDRDRVWCKSWYGVEAEALQMPREQSCCHWTVQEDAVLQIPDLTRDERSCRLPAATGAPHCRMYCGANLITPDGYRIGTVCVMDDKARRVTELQCLQLQRLAQQAMELIELRAKEAKLAQVQSRMQQLAGTDALTGLVNRRLLFERLGDEMTRAQRFGTLLSVLRIDLDHLKQLDELWGHDVGDALLSGVAELVRQRVRSIDIAASLGEEELCVVLPGTGLAGALAVAEDLRRRIAATRFDCHGQAVQITASFGVAANDAAIHPDALSIYKAADRALLRAKQGGRDCVEAASAGVL